jgi:phage terminase large subunit-like protein
MKSGNLTATPGNVIDYDYIVNDILESCELYNVRMIGYDPFNADLIVPKLSEQGVEVGAVRQGYLTLSPAAKKLEVMVLSKEVYHSGCPIMRWNMANVELETDAAGNIKPSKAKSKNKIDGVAALVTALAAYMHTEINLEGEITLEQIKKMIG